MPTIIECPSLEQNLKPCAGLGLDFIEINMNLPEYQLDQMTYPVLNGFSKIIK